MEQFNENEFKTNENDFEKFKILNEAKDFLKGIMNGKNIDINIYFRIFNTSMIICQSVPQSDFFIIGLVSLLFDIDNKKIFKSENNENLKLFFKDYEIDEETLNEIINNINIISNFNEDNNLKASTLEQCIIMDSIILENFGAIGLAKFFFEGGKKKLSMFKKEIEDKKKKLSMFKKEDLEIIKNNERLKEEKIKKKEEEKIKKKFSSKLSQFKEENYEDIKPKSIIGNLEEEIIKIKNKLYTDKAKLIAMQKQKFMFDFLKEFYKEIGEKQHIKEIEDKKNKEIEKENIRFKKKKKINQEEEKENIREEKKNELETEEEQKKLEEIFEIERGEANLRILKKKKEIEEKIEEYEKILTKQNNTKEKNNNNNIGESI